MVRLLCPIATALVLLATPAAAQRGPIYCNVTEVKAEQLANATRVTIVTDGTPEWDIDWEQLVAEGGFRRVQAEWGEDWWPTDRFTHLPVRIMNAKSSLGTGFVAIGKYPVSHVTISIPEWAREGVGVELDIVNYLGFSVGEGELSRTRYDFMTSMSEDHTSILITWMLEGKFPAPPPPPAPEDLPQELSVSARDGLLTIRAVHAQLRALTGAVSRAIGVAITAPPDGDLRVSANLERVSPEAAIEALARGCGLCAQLCSDGSWLVAQPRSTEGGYGASCARVVPLTYLRAADAMDLLPSFLLDYLRVDEEANSVIANGPVWLVERVQQDLAKLDLPPPEVVLEVVAVEYTSMKVMVRELNLARYLGDFAGALETLSGAIELLWLEGLPRGWDAALNARESRAVSRLHSRAALRVASGRTARISAGQRRYIIVERIGEGLTADIQPSEVGVTLDAQPRLGSGDEIVLSLTLQLRTVRSADPATGLPTLGVRQVKQTVRVRDGDTVAIAGLPLAEGERTVRSVPVLGSLPLLGPLFQSVGRSEADTELAVFVTPRIIRSQATQQGDHPYG